MMQPAWLSDSESTSTVPIKQVTNSGSSKTTFSAVPLSDTGATLGGAGIAAASQKTQNQKIIHYALKAITMGLCILMSATAIIGLGSITGVDKSGKIFVATYMFFFSALLFMFELSSLLPPSKPTETLDHMFRRNFGFLYSSMGKSFFIIFVAFLSFGLGDPVNLTLATGISFASFGALTLSLYLKYPELFDE